MNIGRELDALVFDDQISELTEKSDNEKELNIIELNNLCDVYADKEFYLRSKILAQEKIIAKMEEALVTSLKENDCTCDIESIDGHHLYICYKHQALTALKEFRNKQ